jgi:signal peptidase I
MTSFQRRKLKKKLRQFKVQVNYILHNDDDILSGSQKSGLQALAAETDSVKFDNAGDAGKMLDEGQQKLARLIHHKKFPVLREYLDIIAVAVVVAFGIRGVFFQPFKIPTSSMQPTLYGVHHISQNDTIAKFPPILQYLLFSAGKTDPYGATVSSGWYSLGDHLFVDRYSHHINGLNRGDVVVFNTEGVVGPDGNRLADKGYYYIKRLVGLPGDTLKIVDNKLYVKPAGENDFRPVTDFSPKFDKVYSGKGGYQGHRNAKPFMGEGEFCVVPEDSYFMMGDNTAYSYDSRYWGIVPRKNIVGKASVVFWPFSRRWGLVDRQPPLDVPTGPPDYEDRTFKSMSLQ